MEHVLLIASYHSETQVLTSNQSGFDVWIKDLPRKKEMKMKKEKLEDLMVRTVKSSNFSIFFLLVIKCLQTKSVSQNVIPYVQA